MNHSYYFVNLWKLCFRLSVFNFDEYPLMVCVCGCINLSMLNRGVVHLIDMEDLRLMQILRIF